MHPQMQISQLHPKLTGKLIACTYLIDLLLRHMLHLELVDLLLQIHVRALALADFLRQRMCHMSVWGEEQEHMTGGDEHSMCMVDTSN